MVKDEFNTINVGLFGHIDHGKTTLLQRLSGKWTDTHSEELKRGITIKLGYADVTLYKDSDGLNIEKKGQPVRHLSFIDAPGHEMLMATMLSGAALIDAAILVVAANEGIKPQTREHFMALKAKRVKNLIVVQNKIDLADIEKAKKNYQDIRNLLGEEYSSAPVIPVSAQQNVNIDKIWQALVDVPTPDRQAEKDPVFIVARTFDINRPGTKPSELHGTVLGGSLKCGELKVGDEIEIKPGRKVKKGESTVLEPVVTKVRSLFKGSQKVQTLTPGGSMSIETELDMSLGKGDALSGNVVSMKGKLPEPTTIVSLKYSLFPEVFGIGGHTKVENIKQGEMLMLSINTSITGGTVSAINSDSVSISLKVPVVVFKDDNVGIARNIQGHWRLIGYGTVK